MQRSKTVLTCFLGYLNRPFMKSNRHRYCKSRRGVSTSTCCMNEVKAVFSNRRTIKLKAEVYAKIADGAIVAEIGNTAVLVAAVSKYHDGPDLGFFPLTVDYRQKYAAAGRIPSNYLRREVTRTDKEILTARIIDRSIRPLFPEGYNGNTQISCHLLAVDGNNDPDIACINAASAALAVSDIPWNGPIGSVRVALVDKEIITQPTRRELSMSSLNLIVSGAADNLVVMLEGNADNVVLPELMKAIKVGVKECQQIIQAINTLSKLSGKPKKTFKVIEEIPENIMEIVRTLGEVELRGIFTDFSHNKQSRDNAILVLSEDIIGMLKNDYPEIDPKMIGRAFNKLRKEIFRNLILDEDIRCDGRDSTDLRLINCMVDLYKPLHGSSVFRRGQTQVQCTVAFDAPENIPKLDPLLQATGGYKDRNFILHYSFPSFATNDVSSISSISRREIGHGALAEKALRPLLPANHPFAILLTSTVMESNGSSSMATVCGGSLALMDAGVKLSAPAAGVALGLVTRYDENNKIKDYKILTDILGIEDFMGDMDFKIAGTRKGVTALQLDIKVPGIDIKIVMESLKQAHSAKCDILNVMDITLSNPRMNKGNSPIIKKLIIPPNKRSRILGTGGIHFRKIESETGVQITWTDNNEISLFAPNESAMVEAEETLTELANVKEPLLEFGCIYTATIVEICSHGVMVTLYNNMTPVLLPNSQLDARKVKHASALNLEVGQEVKVKYFGRDPNSGQLRLSRRAIQALAIPDMNLHKSTET